MPSIMSIGWLPSNHLLGTPPTLIYITVRHCEYIPLESKVSIRIHVMEWPPEPGDKWLDNVAQMENLLALVTVDEKHMPMDKRNAPKKKVERLFRRYVHMVLEGGQLPHQDIDSAFYPLSFDYGYLTSKGDDKRYMEDVLLSTMVASVVPLSQRLMDIANRRRSINDIVCGDHMTMVGRLKVLAPYLRVDGVRGGKTVIYRDLIRPK